VTYDFTELERASRELYIACALDGRVLHADARAYAALGVRPGSSLSAIVAPGCEQKLSQFLADSRTREVRECEIVFGVRGKALTVALSSRPHPDGALLLGHIIPAPVTHALDRVNEILSEVTTLNRTILAQRDELAERAAELTRINQELSESNQGVRALLTELQDKAEIAQQDAEVKSRMIANLSHELRTPLHSILGLVQLLASGVDGALGPEQQKQIGYIKASADDLLGLVNDVLDLGQLEANRSQVRIERFTATELLAAMRGVLRPLVAADSRVELVIDEPPPSIQLETDRTKLSQILRNLVSNALKFTERGTVRVSSRREGDRFIVEVADTGIGIAPADLERIFEEYGQIESHLQKRLKGTGLGLPIARRLAERLGGTVTVTSEIGKGSTFRVEVPVAHDEAKQMQQLVERSREKPPGAASILVVEDDRKTLFLYEKYLVMAGFHVMPARTVAEAHELMQRQRPAAIVLDVMLEGDASWSFLASVKNDPETQDIPVLVVTVTNREDKARALGADEFWLKPIDQDRLLRKLRELATRGPVARVLVIDDDATARYLIKRHLEGTPYQLFEAATGEEGIASAREHHPNVILLDFLLGAGITAFDVLDELKADARTRGIPVIVVTSQVLDELDRKRLLEEAEAVISKQNLSRELAINRIRDALRKGERGV